MNAFHRLLDKGVVFKGDRALPIGDYLIIRVNPPKKASGFTNTSGKACTQASRGDRGEAGHALGVDGATGSEGSRIRVWLSN